MYTYLYYNILWSNYNVVSDLNPSTPVKFRGWTSRCQADVLTNRLVGCKLLLHLSGLLIRPT